MLAFLEGLGVTGDTAKQHFSLIKMVNTDAIYRGFTTVDVVSAVAASLPWKKSETLIRIPDDGQIMLVRTVSGPRTRLMLTVSTQMGMEATEVDRAMRRGFDFAKEKVFIRHLPVDGQVLGRWVKMTDQTQLDALRWMAVSPGAADDLLFTGNDANQIYVCLTGPPRQVGLVSKPSKNGDMLPLFQPRHFTWVAAQTRAAQGMDLLTLTEELGFANTETVHDRVGWIIEHQAHGENDRAMIATAAGKAL